ncbi:hypothetical protein [Spirulina sp. 06S082]|uniref:AbiU2 domain-containing protein n=1 Tax=Spirulina sp. 06S082 TaxID=3110248 RepID=UPI002B215E60|nr:hypothetical protein [Spirulina sp. 06S082]MEA5469543.1 hypothetical protein [Spirulina sp. 06S082]
MVNRQEFTEQYFKVIGFLLQKYHFDTILYESFSKNSIVSITIGHYFLKLVENSLRRSILLYIHNIYDKDNEVISFYKAFNVMRSNLRYWDFDNKKQEEITRQINKDEESLKSDEILQNIEKERNKIIAHLERKMLEKRQNFEEELDRDLEEIDQLDNPLFSSDPIHNFPDSFAKILDKTRSHDTNPMVINRTENFNHCCEKGIDIYNKYVDLLGLDLSNIHVSQEKTKEEIEKYKQYFSSIYKISCPELEELDPLSKYLDLYRNASND